MTIRIGDQLRNNDPRKNGEIVTVTRALDGAVGYQAKTRVAWIKRDRIFTDGKKRAQGYTWLKHTPEVTIEKTTAPAPIGPLKVGDKVRVLPSAREIHVPVHLLGKVVVITQYPATDSRYDFRAEVDAKSLGCGYRFKDVERV